MTLIPVDKVITDPGQPRKRFDKEKLEELAQSIKENGLIQPIRVEDLGDGTYHLVAGERRLRAHQLLGRDTIEANIVALSNHNGRDRFAQAFVENVQREDMNAMEISNGYQVLLETLGSVKAVCRRVGKSDAHVYGYLALQEFEPEVKAFFERGLISVDPRVVAALKKLSSEQRIEVATRAAVRGSSSATVIVMCQHRSGIMPVARQAGRQAGRQDTYISADETVSDGHFDALCMVKGSFTENITTGARETCKACELYDMASPNTCRECPMVDFLRRLK